MTELWLGSKFKAIRNAKGLTQEEFGRLLHISASYVSKIEAGKQVPDDGVLDVLMLKYRVSVDWWEAGEGPMFAEKEKPLDDPIRELLIGIVDRVLAGKTESEKLAFTKAVSEIAVESKKD